jgi:pimeloyl-ACP methyl ester carboxylesterase
MVDVAFGRRRDHPYVRVGPPADATDRTPLVIVTGLNDPLLRVTDAVWFGAAIAAFGLRLRGRGYPGPVYLYSRPAGLPADATTRRMAAALDDALPTAPVDLLGISMGGFVVQHLAARRPDRVERLVLGLAGARLSAHGRERIGRWRDWAAAGQWGRVYRAGVDAVAVGTLRRAMRAATYPYERLASIPPAAVDFDVSAQACLAHDGSDAIRAIDRPTLVVGGTEDPFFTVAEFERTARLASAPFVRLDGVGHEAVVCEGPRFDRPIVEFLAGGRE